MEHPKAVVVVVQKDHDICHFPGKRGGSVHEQEPCLVMNSLVLSGRCGPGITENQAPTVSQCNYLCANAVWYTSSDRTLRLETLQGYTVLLSNVDTIGGRVIESLLRDFHPMYLLCLFVLIVEMPNGNDKFCYAATDL